MKQIFVLYCCTCQILLTFIIYLYFLIRFFSTSDEGKNEHRFGHATVAGIDRYPRKIVASMKKATQEKRSRIKPFVKTLNYSHIMPTRYSVDFLDAKKSFPEDFTSGAKIAETRKAAKSLFEDKYKNISKTEKKAAGVQYFFSKLRF